MKLHAAHIQRAMTQSHDFAVGRLRGDFQTSGQTGAIDHPRMITPHDKGIFQAGEKFIIGRDPARGGDAVVHFSKLAQASAEDFGNGLQAKTHTEHGNTPRSPPHDVKQPTGFTGKARAGRQQDTIVVIDAFDFHFVARHQMGHGAALAHELYQIVDKGVVAVDDQHVLRCTPRPR